MLDFLTNHGEDDSNASDESFKFDDAYQKEFDDQLNQEKRFMRTVDPMESNEVDPSQIIHGTRDRTLTVELHDNLDIQQQELDSSTSDEDTSQHDMDENSESDADDGGDVADPEDVVVNNVDVPAVDNPLEDDEPNIIEDPDDTSEVESLDNNTPAPLKSELDGPYWAMKQTRHIDIRYFYVTSKIYDQTVTAITYCPTKEIMTNYLSKPLQGSLFRIHQNSIMGSMSRMNMNCTTCI